MKDAHESSHRFTFFKLITVNYNQMIIKNTFKIICRVWLKFKSLSRVFYFVVNRMYTILNSLTFCSRSLKISFLSNGVYLHIDKLNASGNMKKNYFIGISIERCVRHERQHRIDAVSRRMKLFCWEAFLLLINAASCMYKWDILFGDEW